MVLCVSLVAFFGLLAAVYWLGGVDQIGRWLAASALGVLFVTLLLGRDLVMYTSTIQQLNFGLYLVCIGLTVAGVWRLKTPSDQPVSRRSTHSD